MPTTAHLIDRREGVVELYIRSVYPVYRAYGALTLDAAYSGGTLMFSVRRDDHFLSPTIKRTGRNQVQAPNRGLTRISYDPTDYVSSTLPGDGQVGFLRVADVNDAGSELVKGPILVVPPPGFFRAGRVNLILNGTAPNVAGLASNQPPQTAMWIDLPRYADEMVVSNTDSTNDLFISLGDGTQELEIGNGESFTFSTTGSTLISIRGDGGTATFNISAVLVNGINA